MRINNSMRKIIIAVFIAFSAGILGLSIGLYAAHGADSRALLEESVLAQLNASVAAATLGIDGDEMTQFNELNKFFENGDASAYYDADGQFTGSSDDFSGYLRTMLGQLRELRDVSSVDYSYTVLNVGGTYHLIYDTDEEDEEPFCEYEGFAGYAPFKAALKGERAAGILNMEDEWGSYNTAAAPIYSKATGQMVGIVGVDIRSGLLEAGTMQFSSGIVTLSVILTAILLLFGAALTYLLNHIKVIQDNLNRMAHHDKLTDLPNRRYLLKQLDEMTSKRPGNPFALFFIDLDNFKKVNDNAGHDAGDELLRHIAVYLNGVHSNSKVFRMSAGSVNVTARVGGDEFIILVPGMDNEKAACDYAQEILDGFSREHIDKYISKYDVGLSIGISLFPAHISNYHALINYADTAMYHAKKAGKNRYRIYSDEMNLEG